MHHDHQPGNAPHVEMLTIYMCISSRAVNLMQMFCMLIVACICTLRSWGLAIPLFKHCSPTKALFAGHQEDHEGAGC